MGRPARTSPQILLRLILSKSDPDPEPKKEEEEEEEEWPLFHVGRSGDLSYKRWLHPSREGGREGVRAKSVRRW